MWNFCIPCSTPRDFLPILLKHISVLVRPSLQMLLVTALRCQVPCSLETTFHLSTAEDLLLAQHLTYLFLGIVTHFPCKNVTDTSLVIMYFSHLYRFWYVLFQDHSIFLAVSFINGSCTSTLEGKHLPRQFKIHTND